MTKLFFPTKEWTLFLDRDGVLNKRFIDDYVKTPDEFVWIDGVLDSLRIFKDIFGRIVIVTNQQGVGKGLMTEDDLKLVHEKLLSDVNKAEGKIDKIYYAAKLKEENSIFRKPNVGMALIARKDFPEIRFRKSVMVGDTYSDMIFGKKLGMKNVLISGNDINLARNAGLVDLHFNNLKEFANYILKK